MKTSALFLILFASFSAQAKSHCPVRVRKHISRIERRVDRPCPQATGPYSYNGRLINGVVGYGDPSFPVKCPDDHASPPAPVYNGRIINGVVIGQ